MTGVYMASIIGVFVLVSLPCILLGVASVGIAIPVIVAGLFATAVVADLVAMSMVWRVVERENR